MVTVVDARAVKVGPLALPGEWVQVPQAVGTVVFAHGSGSSRRSPRNLAVAEVMHDYRLSTLLFDLLGEDEALERRHVFDIGLLGHRLGEALAWMRQQEAAPRRIGLFGASTGAAAALHAAARHPGWVGAVVSRRRRPATDAALAEQATKKALETGVAQTWSNSRTGNSGRGTVIGS